MGFSNYPSGKVPIPRLENDFEKQEFTKAKRIYAGYIGALIRSLRIWLNLQLMI
jgi:hypothetical protein